MDQNEKKAKIDSAIKAHLEWFKRLKSTVNTGKSDFKPEIVCKDNLCDFGKWIYTDLKNICDDKSFEEIKSLHAQFHKKASEVLVLALEGKKDLVEKEISLSSNSDLIQLSGKLVLLLRQL
ncbi:MAG: CZB domain-containing protein [Oligoflexia bacterium]|nr:CZB domain-containing protein [Oligoflexia bacterium]